ncbi:MAG: MalY/PatB family protein [Thermodesulfobacteriota bacterium]
MSYDFDRPIDRKGTDCVKWDHHELHGEVAGMIPMSIADMDFEAPGFVIDALTARARHGVFGYTVVPQGYYASIAAWLEGRYGWPVAKEWIRFSPGVIPALNFAVQAFTSPGDMVVIQPPVYHPFRYSVTNNGRTVLNNPLTSGNGRYTMDIEGLKELLARAHGRARMLILSNPHNPVGRVWEEDELRELVEVCAGHNVIIVSDEIHCDLVMPGHRHIPTASLSETAARITVTCTSPSKTFNLAELHVANIIMPDSTLFARFDRALLKAGLNRPNVMGLVACEAAYSKGREWVGELVRYLHGNYLFVRDLFAGRLPEVKVSPLEGTYLAWLDLRGLGRPHAEVEETLLRKARVAMTPGHIFGPGGEGFFRMNLACPRATVEEAAGRIARTLKGEAGAAG